MPLVTRNLIPLQDHTVSGSPLSAEEQGALLRWASRPKLIARTSMDILVNPQMPGPITFTGTPNMCRKMLQPARRHPLLHQLWNNAPPSFKIYLGDTLAAQCKHNRSSEGHGSLTLKPHALLILAMKTASISVCITAVYHGYLRCSLR